VARWALAAEVDDSPFDSGLGAILWLLGARCEGVESFGDVNWRVAGSEGQTRDALQAFIALIKVVRQAGVNWRNPNPEPGNQPLSACPISSQDNTGSLN